MPLQFISIHRLDAVRAAFPFGNTPTGSSSRPRAGESPRLPRPQGLSPRSTGARQLPCPVAREAAAQPAVALERSRLGWTQAGTIADRCIHKALSLLGLRTARDQAADFIRFMADADGQPGTSSLPLGDGWVRNTRRVKDQVATLDLSMDGHGSVIDVRRPPRGSRIPEGQEREAFATVLEEMRNRGKDTLRTVPVHYVNRNTHGYFLPTHGYVVAGDPGKGRKSGAVLYGVGGDPVRGPVLLDRPLLKHLLSSMDKAGPARFPAAVRATIAQLAGQRFASREDFFNGYRSVRGDAVDPAAIRKEVASIYRLLPMNTMELWPKTTGDYRAPRPPAPERDIRAFESPPQGLARKVYMRRIEGARQTDLQDARRQFLLHRLYQDELMGRDGSGFPPESVQPRADSPRRHRLVENTPRFQRLPPHASGKVGNCNSGAASLLQRAMDNHARSTPGARAGKAAAASVFGLGSGHRIDLWDPLQDARTGDQP
ncbi:type III effector [Paracidovorax citrulli]|nr:type III effector [Paracidovorax citrulli]WEA82718.1 type III secretion system HopW family effector AopW [Paracidovorax citrulli]